MVAATTAATLARTLALVPDERVASSGVPATSGSSTMPPTDGSGVDVGVGDGVTGVGDGVTGVAVGSPFTIIVPLIKGPCTVHMYAYVPG